MDLRGRKGGRGKEAWKSLKDRQAGEHETLQFGYSIFACQQGTWQMGKFR